MKKLLFIAVPNFQDTEMFNTKQALGKDFSVEVASNMLDTINGIGGSEISPNLLIENAVPSDYDGIVIIGGGGMYDVLHDDPETTDQIIAQVKAFNSAKKLVAAICIGPLALAKAGIINGKKMTIWVDRDGAEKTAVESAGAIFTGQPVTVDGNIITANGPGAATAFGDAIRKYFSPESFKPLIKGGTKK